MHIPTLPHSHTPGHRLYQVLVLQNPHCSTEFVSGGTTTASRSEGETRCPARGSLLTGWVWRGAHSAITAGSTGKKPHALGLSQLQGRASCRRPNTYTLQVSTQRAALGQGSTSTHPHWEQGSRLIHTHPALPDPWHSHRAPGCAHPSKACGWHQLQQPPQLPRLCSCSSTKPSPGAWCRCCASSSSPLSPPRSGEPRVTFQSPTQSPAIPHHCSESALTSKNWGASACAWLAMPMGQAVPFAHTS